MLEGLTVDELARYRRRRIQGQPKDNLGLNIEAESEDLVSEYREAFRAQSEEFLKVSTLDFYLSVILKRKYNSSVTFACTRYVRLNKFYRENI